MNNKFITLLFILTLGFSYSQENIAWNRVDLYVPANQAEAYLEAMEEFYSNIEMPDGVSVSLVRYFYKPKDVKATHSIVFAGPVDGIKGHDYAARVFVIKKTGSTLLSNRAINYVFSSNNDVGENWPSPYTKKSIDYVLSSTKDNLNNWVTVKANVKEDFKKLHEIDVTEISGIAIMTDTDNSKLKAISYYQNIYFSEK